ncbi:heavy metal translocating P-type ATPase [Sulfurospirillum arcachonense]|uniref:heavy metal translocating P-type ATPase n=1 Tax=Sulfurospirillum arcachonense TaxID=57666 RepID=UPI0004B57FD1|nr:heavy metal translocating P-type ATPase [Sulfurospirillum arcachonense]
MSKRKCDHCHLEYDENVLINDSGKYFCCKGCQGIYHLLQDEGLDSFYKKMGENSIEPPKELHDDINKFDLDGFVKKYVKQKDGFSEISLIIDGIHCSACVWLNEKVLHKTAGVVEASINHTNNKAKVIWDNETIKLSEIIQTIRNIGYNAYPYDASMQEEQANAKRRDYYSRLLVGVFTTMNIMWIAIAQYGGYFTGMRADIKSILNFAEFILATPALFYTGGIFFKGSYYALKNRFVNMDLLVVSGALSAYLFSIYSMFSGHGEVYFESVTMIITFVFAGKYLEVLTKKKAVDTMDSFSSFVPNEVSVIRDNEKVIIGVEAVEVGDIIELRGGDKVACDGVIVSGEGSFDNSTLSGESEPVLLGLNDQILSGSICVDSVIRYKVLKPYASSTLSKIISLLEDSMDKKPYIEKLANTISGYFSSVILVLAVLTFCGWFYYTNSFESALIVAISVVVIACPCALGLATPVATLVGISKAAKKGVLFKEATFLETIAKCSTVVLDKTGTITNGTPKVVSSFIQESFDKSILYSLVCLSTHPISKGVKEFLTDEKLSFYDLDDVKTVEAKGIKALYKGKYIYAGNLVFMKENGFTCKENANSYSHLFVVYDSIEVAQFSLQDLPRDGALKTIEYMKKSGLKVIMLTGDNEQVAKKIADEVGISEYKSSLLPQEKAEYIANLRKSGEKVVMVGDGINDTLALANSEVAITLGSGTDVAVNVSDIVLINDSFEGLKTVFEISKSTFSKVKQNLAISILYNVITIPLAMAGFVIPLIAALSMSFSSLIVVGNSMRIK